MEKLLISYTRNEAMRALYLVERFFTGAINHEEHVELDDWVEKDDQNMAVFEELCHPRYKWPETRMELGEQIRSAELLRWEG